MARKTHYDVLEVSRKASPEVITVAFEHLWAKHDPAQQANPADAIARLRHAAIQEAHATLSDPQKRAAYDLTLEALDARTSAPDHAPDRTSVRSAPAVGAAPQPFWGWARMLVGSAVVLGLAALWMNHLQVRARVEADARIAEARAQAQREARDLARVQVEAERATTHRERYREREMGVEEQRRAQERQAALRDFQNDSQRLAALDRSRQEQERLARQQELNEQRNLEQRRRQEEQQAALAARQQVTRERAELCRIERERYGKALSC
jgi:curved DNA-binding protein CbpA